LDTTKFDAEADARLPAPSGTGGLDPVKNWDHNCVLDYPQCDLQNTGDEFTLLRLL